ncbi:MAG: NAD(P)/FAD-dependent oxidoreductase [Gemmatimonadaceae bacterium]
MVTKGRGHSRGRARPLTASSVGPRLRRLVLLGAGRAHLYLLRALSRPLVRGLELVLVTSDRMQYDPAMTSGILRGAYDESEARIDVVALAERAGARVVDARADRFELHTHVVHAGSERIAFDLCSIDEVGAPLGSELPGVIEHAIPLRPASILPEVRGVIEARLADSPEAIRCTVVGGGSVGVECAFALQRILRARRGRGVVTIVDAAPHVLGDLAPCREAAHRTLESRGVCFVLGTRAIAVRSEGVVLASGALLPSDLVVWATGGAAPRVIAESGLEHDAHGRLLVDARLRARSGAPIWAAGDCASVEASAAVDPRRHGEFLEREIRVYLGASHRRVAKASARPLCLLDTGDGGAIVRWGPLHARSRLAGWLKRRLDRRFVARLGSE